MTFDYGYEDGVDITSFVSIRHARYNYDLVPRRTEIAGSDRQAYGGRKPATDSAAALSSAKNDLLRCSDCKTDKHFTLFPLAKAYLHRHAVWIETKKGWIFYGRGYHCDACQKKRRDQVEAANLAEKMGIKPSGKQNRLTRKQREQANKTKSRT